MISTSDLFKKAYLKTRPDKLALNIINKSEDIVKNKILGPIDRRQLLTLGLSRKTKE